MVIGTISAGATRPPSPLISEPSALMPPTTRLPAAITARLRGMFALVHDTRVELVP